MLGAQLNTIHNLHYYQELMASLRHVIEQGKLPDFIKGFIQQQNNLELDL